jgi:hypothetical protein
MVFVPILWCRQSVDNFEENLVKVGYKKDKKVINILKYAFIFLATY